MIPCEKFRWEKGDDEKFRSSLDQPRFQHKISTLLTSTDLTADALALEATKLLIDVSDFSQIKRSGKKRGKHRNRTKRDKAKGWYDRECREFRRRVSCLARGMRKDPFNRALIGEFRSLRKSYKKLLRHKKIIFRTKILDEMEQLRTANPTAYWKLFEQLSDQAPKPKPNISGTQWTEHFKNSMNSDTGTVDGDFIAEAIRKVEEEGGQFFDELSFGIKQEEVYYAIRGLKTGKASSQDLILNEMLKAGENHLVPLLSKIFNKVLCSEKGVPKTWREGIITPVYKKGNRDDPANYRAIVIGSNLGKLYGTILNNRLIKFMDSRNLIPDNQIGYRKRFRTADHILTLKTLIDKCFSGGPGSKLYCCFIDFKNAFPSVSRPLLFYKLMESGIGGKFLRSIQSMYEGVQLNVRLDGGTATHLGWALA